MRTQELGGINKRVRKPLKRKATYLLHESITEFTTSVSMKVVLGLSRKLVILMHTFSKLVLRTAVMIVCYMCTYDALCFNSLIHLLHRNCGNVRIDRHKPMKV